MDNDARHQSPDLAGALASLPHGPEFRFIDRLTALDPGRSGEGEFTLRGSEAFLAGHFPGHPILPGVLMAEAIAQLAGVVAQSDPAHEPLPDLRLTAVRALKILGTAGPGVPIRLTAEVQGRLGNLIQARGTVEAAGEKIAEAQVTLSGG